MYSLICFINSTIIGLLTTQPEIVRFTLVDLKGGVELCDYEHLKQTVSIAYEPEEAKTALETAPFFCPFFYKVICNDMKSKCVKTLIYQQFVCFVKRLETVK